VKIISIVNHKGGVAKTTSAINIGAGLHKLGKKVLVIDLDPQAHLTDGLGIRSHALDNTVYSVFRGDCKIEDAFIDRDGLTVLPSCLELAGAELELSSQPGRDNILQHALETSPRKFQYVIIDCPPGLGMLTINALTASSDIFIALQTEYLALEGLTQLLKIIKQVKERTNPKLNITGVICTMYEARFRFHRDVVESAIERFGNKIFKTPIRKSVKVSESVSHGKTVFEYDPKGTGAADYMALCKEIIKRK
jgi:chromosome partitioning protein